MGTVKNQPNQTEKNIIGDTPVYSHPYHSFAPCTIVATGRRTDKGPGHLDPTWDQLPTATTTTTTTTATTTPKLIPN